MKMLILMQTVLRWLLTGIKILYPILIMEKVTLWIEITEAISFLTML